MGACKILNWCLRDAQTRVFPWGIFYPNQLIPKDVAYVHRNESMVWRWFSPRYVAPALTVCLADNMRLGNQEHLGTQVGYRAFGALLALHYNFNVIDDHHLDALPVQTRTLIYPAPFAIRDDAYARLVSWVEAGGTLLVTGDVSYDADRRPTRRARLHELAGVDFVATRYPNVDRAAGQDVTVAFGWAGLTPARMRPCITCRAAGADVLATTEDRAPALVRNKVGKGVVYWLADPIELDAEAAGSAARRSIYRAFLNAAGCTPLPVEPNAPWLHVMAQPTATGVVHVVFNTQLQEGEEDVTLPTKAGDVTLRTRNRWPALVAASDDGRVLALVAHGQARVRGKRLMDGSGPKALLSLDRLDLCESKAILVGPFDVGRLHLPQAGRERVALIGELRGGEWTTLERVQISHGPAALDIDADRATCMILLCETGREQRWTTVLTAAMTRPERIQGY